MGTVDWTNQRLMIERVLRGDWSQGASGIPQQLARNLFLSPDRTVGRKLREYLLAYQLTHALSKERVLELYLNAIEVADGVWGIAGGSEALFARPPSQLTPTELVLLANVLPAPSKGLSFALSRPRRAKLEIVTRVLWRQRVFDDVSWGATTARLRRMGELVERGLTPSQAAAVAADEMGEEVLQPSSPQPRQPLRVRCDPTQRGLY
jgi:membrane carboxypeptidase/penicillin-binding protein PbpC